MITHVLSLLLSLNVGATGCYLGTVFFIIDCGAHVQVVIYCYSPCPLPHTLRPLYLLCAEIAKEARE